MEEYGTLTTTSETVTVDHKTVTWDELRAAAKQEDPRLAAIYTDILKQALDAESRRLTGENWAQYGFPLLTGYSQRYGGQIVKKAWEIRRLKGELIAYIVTLDGSTGELSRESSPEMADMEAARQWVRGNYGPWHDELGLERTASVWLQQ